MNERQTKFIQERVDEINGTVETTIRDLARTLKTLDPNMEGIDEAADNLVTLVRYNTAELMQGIDPNSAGVPFSHRMDFPQS